MRSVIQLDDQDWSAVSEVHDDEIDGLARDPVESASPGCTIDTLNIDDICEPYLWTKM